MPRDDDRTRTITEQGVYDNLLERRDKKRLSHYTTPVFVGPTARQRKTLATTRRVWSAGDSLMKMSQQYYGNVRYWYVIAWYNFKPTDAHFELGDVVFIPTNLNKILSILRSY